MNYYEYGKQFRPPYRLPSKYIDFISSRENLRQFFMGLFGMNPYCISNERAALIRIQAILKEFNVYSSIKGSFTVSFFELQADINQYKNNVCDNEYCI